MGGSLGVSFRVRVPPARDLVVGVRPSMYHKVWSRERHVESIRADLSRTRHSDATETGGQCSQFGTAIVENMAKL